MIEDIYHQTNEYRARNSGSKKQHMTKTKEPKETSLLSEKTAKYLLDLTLQSNIQELKLRQSIAGIHYIASRRTPPTNVDSFDDRAAFLTIIDECVRCIPELKEIGGVV